MKEGRNKPRGKLVKLNPKPKPELSKQLTNIENNMSPTKLSSHPIRGNQMPFAGLGLHFIVALFFAVHVVRTGQQMY